jgi:transcriptional regulator with XRE-family HTH domain
MKGHDKRYTFGTRLREFRKKRGLSQQGLADRCKGKVTKSNISRLENRPGQRPTLRVVEVFSRVLDWPINEARQLAGYAPVEIDWPAVTASELVYVLEKYPGLSEERRQFVKSQISATVEFMEREEMGGSGLERQVKITPVEKLASIELGDVPEGRGPVKKKRKK